jgi:hypothetical protein
MRSRDTTLADSYFIHNSPCLVEAAERIKRIFNIKYEPADLEKVVANCTYQSEEEKKGLYSLLQDICKSLFDESLEPEKGEDYNIELHSDTTLYHACAFPIPWIHKQTLRHKVNWLYKIGVMKKINRSE